MLDDPQTTEADKISPRTLTAVRQGLRNWATKHDVVVTRTMLDEMLGEIVLAWGGTVDVWK